MSTLQTGLGWMEFWGVQPNLSWFGARARLVLVGGARLPSNRLWLRENSGTFLGRDDGSGLW